MLNQISWAEYLTTVAAATAIWYVAVAYRYYRQDIMDAIKGRNNAGNTLSFTPRLQEQQQRSSPADVTATGESAVPSNNDDTGLSAVQAFCDEVQAYLHEAANNETDKAMLLQSLKVIAAKYTLPSTSYNSKLGQFIIAGCAGHCSIHITEEDARALWN